MLKFIILANKQGAIRLAKYYYLLPKDERLIQENDVLRKCLTRTEKQCSFIDYKNYKLVYKKYATLYFIIGIDKEENELAVFEFIQLIVETLDRYFQKVCELDIMFNIDKVHMILDEMVTNGCIVETNKSRIVAPLYVMDQASKR